MWLGPKPNKQNPWQLFAKHVAHIANLQKAPLALVGHSMGGVAILSALPKIKIAINGVVLLDPVLMGTRIPLMAALTPRKIQRKMPLLRKTYARPDSWENLNDCYRFHRKAKTFRHWSDEVMWDYVKAGTHKENNQFVLSYSKYWEAEVFATAPAAWPKVRHLPKGSMILRAKEDSVIPSRVMTRIGRLNKKITLKDVEGTHLFPLEDSTGTARAIEEQIKSSNQK